MTARTIQNNVLTDGLDRFLLVHRWSVLGMPCVIAVAPTGARYGYVGMPADHSFGANDAETVLANIPVRGEVVLAGHLHRTAGLECLGAIAFKWIAMEFRADQGIRWTEGLMKSELVTLAGFAARLGKE